MQDNNNNNRRQNKNTEVIDLLDIVSLLLSKWWILLLTAIAFGGAMYSYSEFVLPREYQSYTSLYVKNANSDTEQNSQGNLSDINASKSLVNTYIAVLSDDAVIEAVGERLLEKYPSETISGVLRLNDEGKISIGSIRDCVSMAAVNQTEVLKVTAVTTDPIISAAICNTIAELAPEVLIRVVGAGSVEAIGEAKPLYTPVAPNVMKNAIIGALLGFILSAGIIILIDFLDNTVKSSKELSDRFGMAIIGEVQEFGVDAREAKKAKRSTDIKRSTLLDKSTPFYITESYKAMRTNMVFSLSTSDKKVFGVTSSNPGEGKSTTSANIAIALGQASHKVLLVDADMRKPVQHKTFSRKNHYGLSSVISGQKNVSECIHKNVSENLDLLSAGPKPPNPSELLASEKAARMLEELSQKYDYIIIDTPPVNVVSDTMGLSNSVAGLVMVTRYGYTILESIENAIQKIDLSDMKILGCVINGVSVKENSRYGRYGKYSKYGYSKYAKYGYSKYGYSSYGYGYGNEPEENEKDSDKKESKKEKVKSHAD